MTDKYMIVRDVLEKLQNIDPNLPIALQDTLLECDEFNTLKNIEVRELQDITNPGYDSLDNPLTITAVCFLYD